MTFDVIIIGGGLAGLSTGALLTRQGKRTLILEREDCLGGRAAPAVKEGFMIGGPFFAEYSEDSPHVRSLRVLGASIPTIRLQRPLCWVARDGALTPHPMPGSPATLLSGALPFFLRRSLSPLHQRIMGMRPDEAWDIPLNIWLNSYASNEAVKRFIHETTQILNFNADDDGFSTGHFIAQYQRMVRAKNTVRIVPAGGWSAYMEVCRNAIEQGGGQIRTGKAVRQIELSDSEVIWLSLENGERLNADTYVVAFPRQFVRPLITQAIESVKFRVAQWTRIEPVRGVTLNLGVKGLSVGSRSLISVPDQRTLVACPSVWDASVAPPDAHLISAMRLLSENEFSHPETVEQSHKLLAECVETLYPGALSAAVFREYTTQPMISGARHRQGQSLPHLLKYRIPELNNLFFAGDTTAAEGEMADVAIQSALHLTDMIKNHTPTRPARMEGA